MRPLEVVRPFLNILPDIKAPDRRVPFRERALYTAVALFVFLVCSQLPLYGIKTNAGSDPFYWARVIMASNRCVECRGMERIDALHCWRGATATAMRARRAAGTPRTRLRIRFGVRP
jgi:hypothetical protein